MARKSSKASEEAAAPATGKSKRSKAVVEDEYVDDEPAGGLGPKIADAMTRRRFKAAVAIGVVGLMAWGAKSAWRVAAPTIAAREGYLVPADRITVTDPPEWIVSDVRAQVVETAGLDRRLSILDPGFAESVKQPFAMHPWIRSVDRVEKRVPAGVFLEVTYRKPVAVIETPDGNSRKLLPADIMGVLLPAEEVPLIRREHLPRVTGIVGQPPVGQAWEDPRVYGAVEIAAMLGHLWEQLHLQEITPSTRPEVSGTHQYFVYELVSRHGTRIQWGPAPRAKLPGEDAFAVKLERLQECIKKYGPLDSLDAPGTINVRGGLQVGPRMVKKPTERMVKKPEDDVVK
ncbi:cell division protein FtsQ/DivIB [Lacipirellula sp.]|uniref:cell division protein FtsQ/DivIB n=1 Tax=Lacipirellula sp. TaxID=2691419 RepID=UPI003D0ABA56